MNIAVCDDDTGMIETLTAMLYETADIHGLSIRCSIFFDGMSLIEAVKGQGIYFDLIYMDRKMCGMSGIQTAQAIRDIGVLNLIVFISAYEEYMAELFWVEPFRFLRKPIDMVEFRNVFLAACRRINRTARYYTFFFNKTIYKIPFDRIIYFESRDRVIYICTVGSRNALEIDKFYGKMKDVERQVTSMDGRFLRIHQSFLVNFDHIKRTTYTEVEMFGGRRLQISKDRQKSVRDRLCVLLNG